MCISINHIHNCLIGGNVFSCSTKTAFVLNSWFNPYKAYTTIAKKIFNCRDIFQDLSDKKGTPLSVDILLTAS